VFYDKGSYSDGWRYFEAAPSSREFEAKWDTAVRKIRNQKTGGTGWRLPSIDELELMYKNLKLNGVGGFSSGTYWSSNAGGIIITEHRFYFSRMASRGFPTKKATTGFARYGVFRSVL
jgi:hypothetical protein